MGAPDGVHLIRGLGSVWCAGFGRFIVSVGTPRAPGRGPWQIALADPADVPSGAPRHHRSPFAGFGPAKPLSWLVCGRVVRTAAAVSSASSAKECLGCRNAGHHDQRKGREQSQEANRRRIAECFAQALPEDELRKRQREEDCKDDDGHELTMRRSRRDGRSS